MDTLMEVLVFILGIAGAISLGIAALAVVLVVSKLRRR